MPDGFNAESEIKSAAGVNPTHDALLASRMVLRDGAGIRVEKSNGSTRTLYWRAITGDAIAETDLTGSTSNSAYKEYIFFAGRRVAWRDASGDVYFYYADALGSTNVITTGNGTPCYQATFTPYGEEHATQNTCSQNYKFTGYERDPETGLDYAFFRYYNSRLGRFMSPDPLGGAVSNPQTLNRYAYVANNPTDMTDPFGLHCAVGLPCPQGWGDPSDPWSWTSGWGGGGGGCTIDGVAGNCSSPLFGLALDAGYAAPCPGNDCSLIQTGLNGQWQIFQQGRDPNPPCSLGAVCVGTAGTFADVTLVYVANPDPGWWGTFASTFFGGILHGVRQPNQSFSQCVLQNANDATGGAHKALIATMGATAAAAVATYTRFQNPYPTAAPSLSAAAFIGLWAGRAVYTLSGGLISGLTVVAPVANGIAAAGQYGAPIALAAEVGLLIGSAINCR
jgi:RHS repeat-associated protein